MLKGVGRTRYLGAPLLAIGFLTHEVSFFCVAMICLVALAFDWRRFWGPVLACVAVSGCAFLAECLAYRVLLGDPLARFRMAGILAGLHDRRLRPRYDGGPRGDRRVGLFRLAYQQSVLLQAFWL